LAQSENFSCPANTARSARLTPTSAPLFRPLLFRHLEHPSPTLVFFLAGVHSTRPTFVSVCVNPSGMPPTLTFSSLLSSWAPTSLGPHAHGTRPCGPGRGHSFQTRVTSPWSRCALRTAPTRTLPSGPPLTTWSRPHGSGRPTRAPALSRTHTVTSPCPGSALRHLPDSDAHDLRGSPLGPPDQPAQPLRSPLFPRCNSNSGRATKAPNRYHYLGDPQLGRHNYLTLRHTTDLRVSV
jgi:hypothetical protein